MRKDYNEELRDAIAAGLLPLLLVKCEHNELWQITDLCYEIADLMLASRNKKQDNLFTNFKDKK
ncbi:MAG: hypothetical protein NT007_01310 [Candidatus Kapabacteria bacterium]|nr:hypothetical protein [Candidatus Kapabacteria bacterium]